MVGSTNEWFCHWTMQNGRLIVWHALDQRNIPIDKWHISISNSTVICARINIYLLAIISKMYFDLFVYRGNIVLCYITNMRQIFSNLLLSFISKTISLLFKAFIVVMHLIIKTVINYIYVIKLVIWSKFYHFTAAYVARSNLVITY